MGPGAISVVTAADERSTKSESSCLCVLMLGDRCATADRTWIAERKSTHLSGTVTPSYHDMPPPALPSLHLPASHAHSSINLSPALHSGAPSYHQHIPVSSRSSNPGRKNRLPSQTPEVEVDVEIDMDAEGEAEENGDDNALYCFCQEKSWGEMIGCDNQECRFEWVSLGLASYTLPHRTEDTNPATQFNLLNSTHAVPPQVCQARSSSTRDLVLSRLRRRTRPRGQQRETQTETEGEEKVAPIDPAVLWLVLICSLVSILSVVSCPKSCIHH
jgi:hypothetical protein